MGGIFRGFRRGTSRNINANRFSHKTFFPPSPIFTRRKRKLFPFLLLLCVSFTNEIEKLCLITGIYIRHCSSDSPTLSLLPLRAFFAQSISSSLKEHCKGKKYFAQTLRYRNVYTCFELQNGETMREIRIDNHTEI